MSDQQESNGTRVVQRRRFLQFAGAAGGAAAAGLLLRPGEAGATVSSGPVVAWASSYGWSATDNTTALQSALDSGADFVVIDVVNGQSSTTWLTGPLFVNNDDFTIILQPGVTVQTITGYTGQQCLLSIWGHSGITLWGYGATLLMNKAEYPKTSQYIDALSVRGSDAIWIEGVTLKEAGGDGLNIGPVSGSTSKSYPQYCSNVTVKNVTCDGSNRNGMSVTSVDGLTVQGCAFVNSIGQSPEAGVDFEPVNPSWYPDQRIGIVIISDSVFSNNHESGLDVSLSGTSGTAVPVTISLERVRISGNGGAAAMSVHGQDTTAGGNADPGGNVTTTASLIYAINNAGCVQVLHKWPSGMSLEFDNTVYWQESTESARFKPIELGPASNISSPTDELQAYGGVVWNNTSVITNQAPPFVKVENDSLAPDGVSGLDGTITVAGSLGVSMDLGANPHDNTLTVTSRSQAPAATVGVTASATSMSAGGMCLLTFTRDTADTAPLAITYSVAVSGTAYLDGLSGCAVILGGATSAIVPLRSRAPWYLGWLGAANAGTVTVTISPADFSYTVGAAASVSVSIT